MTKLGQRILQSVQEAIDWGGGIDNGGILHEFPDVKAIRTRLGLTQAAFAERFGLALGSVRDWEQGRTAPDRPARVLLQVIAHNPEAVAVAAAIRQPASPRRPKPSRQRSAA